MTDLTGSELELLDSYKNGRRVWDATTILPGVWALAGKGLIEPTGDYESGLYQLTDAGREELRMRGITGTDIPRKRGVLGGVEPDPDRGKPYRNTRRKCRLMMEGMSGDKYAAALSLLIDKRPEDVLDALIEVSGES